MPGIGLASRMFACLLGLSALATAGNASAEGLQGKRVALLTNVLTSGWIAGFNAAFIDQMSAQGVKVVNMTSPSDAALQSQQIDDSIAQKFDVIVLHSINEAAVLPALERTKKAGVPVILSIEPLPAGHDDLYHSVVWLDIPNLGRSSADQLALAMNGKPGNVVIIQGVPTQTLVPIEREAFKEELAAKAPKLKIVAVEGKSWNPDEAANTIRQLSLRFGAQGGIQGVFTMNDFQASAVISALESGGAKPGQDVFVVAGGCAKSGIANIKAGKLLSTQELSPVGTGKLTAKVVADFMQGAKIEKNIYYPVAAVTKANVDKYEAACTY